MVTQKKTIDKLKQEMKFIRERADKNKLIINHIRESATLLKTPNDKSHPNPPMTPPVNMSDKESEILMSRSSLTARPTSTVNEGYRSLLLASPRK